MKSESPSRHFQDKLENSAMSTRSLLGLFCLNLNAKFGNLSTWTCHVPRNRSGTQPCAVSSAASEARSRNNALRGVGAPEQLQHDLRMSLAQPSPSVAPQKINAVVNPVFPPSLPPKPHEHQPRPDFAQKFDSFHEFLFNRSSCYPTTELYSHSSWIQTLKTQASKKKTKKYLVKKRRQKTQCSVTGRRGE